MSNKARILPPFLINQKVFHICRKHEQIKTPCKFCARRGKIIGADKTSISCPSCRGQKHKLDYGMQKWTINRKGKIGFIRTAFFAEKDGGPMLRKAEYMFYETGIGSGSVYMEKDLFFSKQLALNECNFRNSLPEKSDG